MDSMKHSIGVEGASTYSTRFLVYHQARRTQLGMDLKAGGIIQHSESLGVAQALTGSLPTSFPNYLVLGVSRSSEGTPQIDVVLGVAGAPKRRVRLPCPNKVVNHMRFVEHVCLETYGDNAFHFEVSISSAWDIFLFDTIAVASQVLGGFEVGCSADDRQSSGQTSYGDHSGTLGVGSNILPVGSLQSVVINDG
ncbi:hypothetical protein H5410_031446 [Solanum commersonii]|uniref:Uncharacterized protein n=1 Tax=Solanum commersonii TaxID=4109 RepID=A0A9J5YLR0_SOLCO|nr:hypothetical protein H5410_031446 [Solanum commersonii]